MAYDLEIRYRCRALFEVMDMKLKDISKQESVPISTLSEWKNDDRDEYGGIWLKGCKTSQVTQAKEKLQKELEATSIYDEMKNKLKHHYGITKSGNLVIDGLLNLGNSNEELQASVETDIALLGAVQSDYFDAQLFKNSMLSSIVLNNQVKKDITKVKQSDIKASSEIHKLAKEARFGKTPDTVIFNNNGDYTSEELANMSLEELERLLKNQEENQQIIIAQDDTHSDTQKLSLSQNP